MQSVISDIDYEKINSFINSKMGLNFPIERKGDLAKALNNAASDFQLENASDLVDYLISSPLSDNEFQILSRHLTIGETYFFREKIIFDILRNIILPEIITKRAKVCQKIKIWSAGCSSGEEAYSLAILMNEMILNRLDWDLTILATDINPDVLEKARNGNYSEWSFRDVNETIKKKYFTKTSSNCYSTLPKIKKMVEFNQLNLVEDSFPSVINKTNAVDIIFCRNVLMYFEPKKREKVISAFYNSLVNGGWLILGLTEIGYMADKRFNSISLKDAIIFQKAPNPSEIPKRKISPITDRPDKSAKIKKSYLPKTKKIDLDVERKNDSLSNYKKGLDLFEKGDYNNAAAVLIKYIENNSKETYKDISEFPKPYYYLAKALANAGRLNSALEWCERGIEKSKLDPALYFLKSNLLQGLNKYMEAIETLKKTIYLDSDYIMAYFSLGNIYKKIDMINEAQRQYKKLLKILSQLDDNQIIKDSEGMRVDRIKNLVNIFLQNPVENQLS